MSKLHDQLQTLETSRLIQLASYEPELEYLFRHGLVQSAAYESMLRRQRKNLHRAIGETLERLHADRLDEHAGILAYHFSRAQEPEKSLHYLMRAARRAAASYANQEAITYYQAAEKQMALLLAQSQGWGQDAAQLAEGLAEVLMHIGQRAEARAALEQALTHVPSFERIWQARLHRKIGQAMVDRSTKIDKYGVAGALLGEPSPASSSLWWQEWLELQMRLAYYHYYGDNIAQMEAVLRQMEPHVRDHGSLRQRASFASAMASVLYRRERYRIDETILRYAHHALELSEQMHDPGHLAAAQAELGCCYMWYGDLERAETYMRQSLEFAERADNIWIECQNVTHLTTVHRLHGNVEQARVFAQRALERASLVQVQHYIGAAHANLCWVAWRGGDLPLAHDHAAAALDHWNKGQGYPWGWLVRLPLLAMALADADLAAARDHARAIGDPGQERLPDPLINALQAGIEEQDNASAIEHLTHAIDKASALGYL